MMEKDVTRNISNNEASKKVFRWLNFGSCLLRVLFNTSEFRNGSFAGLPLQISQVWRREISAFLSDWDVELNFVNSVDSSAFTQSWLSSPVFFQQADIILVDLTLDIFHPHCLRFRRPEEPSGITYNRIVTNFPEELPVEIEENIGAFPCDENSSLAAWKRFGYDITTPTVFMTIEHRDDLPQGYPEVLRKRILSYQAAIAELAKQFPHWLVISIDDILAGHDLDCYIDRHHPTPLGWQILRENIPRIIEESNILSRNPGGVPLPIRDIGIPERCDFGVLNDNHFKRLSYLGGTACAIGSKRLTSTAQLAFGSQLAVYNSFSQLNNKSSPDLIIILKWSQPSGLPDWLAGIIKQHPESLIEIPTLWGGRELHMISSTEKTLRLDLKSFAQTHKTGEINIPTLRPMMRRYLARCLLSSHQPDSEFSRLTPIIKDNSYCIDLPEELINMLVTINPIAVFGVL